MRKVLYGLIVLLGCMAAQAKTPEPDFAFPTKVISGAEQKIKTSGGKGPVAVEAMLETVVATMALDGDSVFLLPDLIDRMAGNEPSQALKSLLLTMEAQTLSTIYQHDRWKYDRTDTPDEPLPGDVAEWNGRQFRSRIQSLVLQAFELGCSDPRPLADYKNIVTADKIALLYYPTVRDFAALKAVELLEQVADYSDDIRNTVRSLTEKEVSLCEEGSYGFINWTLRLYNYADFNEVVAYDEDSSNDLQHRLLELYNKYAGYEAARQILTGYINQFSCRNITPAAVSLVRNSLELWPNYWDNNRLRNELNDCLRPWIEVEAPQTAIPGKECEIKITYGNVNTVCGVNVYRGTDSGSSGANPGKATMALLERHRIEPDAAVPYRTQTTFTFTPTDEVYYFVRAFVGDSISPKNGAVSILATSLTPIVINNCSENAVIVADADAGGPIKGATVKVGIDGRDAIAPLAMGKTDDEGVLRFRLPRQLRSQSGRRYLELKYQGHDYGFGHAIVVDPYDRPYGTRNDYYEAAVYCERPLYHPGDSVGWAIVVAEISPKDRSQRTAADTEFNVRLFDANYQQVADTVVKTDDYGRATGAFRLPVDGLDGNFRIQAEHLGTTIGVNRITVSDFKMPTFKVSIDKVRHNVPSTGWVTASGSATTFSGMPVAGATVEAEISGASRLRWFSPERTLGMVKTTTDGSGNFSVLLPDSLLGTMYHDFMVAVKVTAADGESESADRNFTTGKPIYIRAAAANIDCGEACRLPIEIYDADGKVVSPRVNWQLCHNEMAVASGHATGPEYSVDWHSVPSGNYTLKVVTANPQLSDSTTAKVALYNTKLNTMPSDSPLFVPERRMTFSDGQAGELLYGLPEGGFVYMTLCVDSLLVSTEGIDNAPGFHRLKLALPKGYEEGRLDLFAVKDGKVYSYEVSVEEKVDRRITIEGETFRDKLTPGDEEHWCLRLTGHDGKALEEAAMIATAYNKAILSLTGSNRPAMPQRQYTYPKIGLRTYAKSWYRSLDINMTLPLEKALLTTSWQVPTFRYPISYDGYRRVYKARTTADGMVVVTEESKMYTTAAMMGAADVRAEDLRNVLTAEVAEESEPEATAPVASANDGFEYRPAEVLQALWQPCLTTDAEGNVDINFTVPNANTTWAFMATAWNKQVDNGNFTADVMATKPVMVQPNLPRFLRAGDKAEILASVYNNSENTAVITTTVETFKPDSRLILTTDTVSTTIAAKSSAIVRLPITAPTDASAIAYRIRSASDNFSDGEQALIAILPATTDLIESDIFTMTANTVVQELELPKADGGRRLTLEFCSNPAWDVIKALPSLYQSEVSTSTAASRMLFRAAASQGLLHSDPQIEQQLRRVLDNPADSSLVSQLQQNEELKIAALQQTPWVQAAQSQTAAMARLGLLFDNKAVSKDISRALDQLEKLQNPDGGFRWGQWSRESSRWATDNVLLDVARLNAMGYLPTDSHLDSMVQSALDYRETTLKDEKTDLILTWLYTLQPQYEPGTKARTVINNTVADLRTNWRRYDVAGKSVAAVLLEKHGHSDTVAEILASVADFARTRSNGEIYFPSVDDIDTYSMVLFAYSLVAADEYRPFIDGIRQWLTMRSQRTYALATCDPTLLIAAYVRSGSRWTVPAVPPTVSLGGRRLELPESENISGHFTMNIDAAGSGRSLTIDRVNPQTPAWGALFSQFTARTDEVKAVACQEVSIEKQLSVLRDGQWQYTGDIRLGERVRVLLTIKAADDLQYVAVTDDRSAGFEPADQLPGYVSSGGAMFYRENGDNATQLFISWLPRGTYSISYELYANMAGEFISGVATVQSQYAPAVTAHSSAARISVR